MAAEVEGIMAALECSEHHARLLMDRLLGHGLKVVGREPSAAMCGEWDHAEMIWPAMWDAAEPTVLPGVAEPVPALPVLPEHPGEAAPEWNVGLTETAEAKDSL